MRDERQPGRVRAWVEGYVRAWNSNDPTAIGDLFTEDAVYFTEPWRGRDEIVRRWRVYSNLWVIRLDAEGRCAEFTEWWMRHPDR